MDCKVIYMLTSPVQVFDVSGLCGHNNDPFNKIMIFHKCSHTKLFINCYLCLREISDMPLLLNDD